MKNMKKYIIEESCSDENGHEWRTVQTINNPCTYQEAKKIEHHVCIQNPGSKFRLSQTRRKK